MLKITTKEKNRGVSAVQLRARGGDIHTSFNSEYDIDIMLLIYQPLTTNTVEHLLIRCKAPDSFHAHSQHKPDGRTA